MMKFIIHTDENKYVTCLELSISDEAIEIPNEVYESHDLICYKFENGTFTFDELKKARLVAEEERRKEEEKLKPTTDDLAEALDILTGIVLGGE